jgi:hypothetical protein
MWISRTHAVIHNPLRNPQSAIRNPNSSFLIRLESNRILSSCAEGAGANSVLQN